MVELKSVDQVADLEIKSLSQIIAEAPPEVRFHYRRWEETEQRLLREGGAVELPGLEAGLAAFILKRHQFDQRSLIEIAAELRVPRTSLVNLISKMNIPTRNQRETAGLKRYRDEKSRSRKGRPLSKRNKEGIRLANFRRYGHDPNYIYSLDYDYLNPDISVRDLLESYEISGNTLYIHIQRLVKESILTRKQCEAVTAIRRNRALYLHKPKTRHITQETRERMSASHLGLPMPDDIRAKLRDSHTTPEMLDLHTRVGLETARNRRYQKYFFQNNYFDSISEAVVATLMQRYIPGFELIEGETFQVTKDTGRIFDFVLEDAIVEWHPIVIKHDTSDGEYEAYKELKADLHTREDRRAFRELIEEYKVDLSIDYWISKQEASDDSRYFRGKEVVLITNVKELHDLLLARYGDNVPSFGRVMVQFRSVAAKVKKVGD